MHLKNIYGEKKSLIRLFAFCAFAWLRLCAFCAFAWLRLCAFCAFFAYEIFS